MTVVGTRPELIKMSRVIDVFDQHTKHILVHTGQNYDYELNRIFFEDMGIREPDHFLDTKGTPAQTVGQVIERTDALIEKEKPDAFMIYGDTNSCLAAYAAKRRKVPVFHMEAGNRCYDQRVPEEINRKIIDHISDINLVLSEHARRYLLAEGIPGDRIIKTGSHVKEILNHYRERINNSDVLERLNLEPGSYFVLSAHREENVDIPEKIDALLQTLERLVAQYDKKIIMSVHPRTRQKIDENKVLSADPRIVFSKPFGYSDYIKLQMQAFCVLSDSGSITEDASLLNLAAVNLRDAHERPEGIDVGAWVMSGLNPERICEAVDVVTSTRKLNIQVPDYDVDYVSHKVLRVVLSYIDLVNREIWKR